MKKCYEPQTVPTMDSSKGKGNRHISVIQSDENQITLSVLRFETALFADGWDACSHFLMALK